MSIRLFACLAALLPLSAIADDHRPVARVASPDGSIAVEVTTDPEGRASYAVSRSGESVIAPSRLGMMFTDASKLERNLELVSQQAGSHDETWELPWGERRLVRDHHNELRVGFAEHADGRQYLAQIYRDGPDAGWQDGQTDIVIESRRVSREDALLLRLAPGGGQAIRFAPSDRRDPRYGAEPAGRD